MWENRIPATTTWEWTECFYLSLEVTVIHQSSWGKKKANNNKILMLFISSWRKQIVLYVLRTLSSIFHNRIGTPKESFNSRYKGRITTRLNGGKAGFTDCPQHWGTGPTAQCNNEPYKLSPQGRTRLYLLHVGTRAQKLASSVLCVPYA